MKFSELPEPIKEKLRGERRDWEVQMDDWYECVYEDFLVIAGLIGLVTDKQAISFSGFWSQDDGASFTGSWSPKEGMVEAIKAHAPQDEKLHGIVGRLVTVAVRMRLRYPDCKLSVEISRSGHNYCHSGCMQFEVEMLEDHDDYVGYLDADTADAGDVKQAFRDLANWLYAQLEKEYDHLTSDEVVDQTFEDEEFDEEGAPC
jgi:hypothetical protein